MAFHTWWQSLLLLLPPATATSAPGPGLAADAAPVLAAALVPTAGADASPPPHSVPAGHAPSPAPAASAPAPAAPAPAAGAAPPLIAAAPFPRHPGALWFILEKRCPMQSLFHSVLACLA